MVHIFYVHKTFIYFSSCFNASLSLTLLSLKRLCTSVKIESAILRCLISAQISSAKGNHTHTWVDGNTIKHPKMYEWLTKAQHVSSDQYLWLKKAVNNMPFITMQMSCVHSCKAWVSIYSLKIC